MDPARAGRRAIAARAALARRLSPDGSRFEISARRHGADFFLGDFAPGFRSDLRAGKMAPSFTFARVLASRENEYVLAGRSVALREPRFSTAILIDARPRPQRILS